MKDRYFYDKLTEKQLRKYLLKLEVEHRFLLGYRNLWFSLKALVALIKEYLKRS